MASFVQVEIGVSVLREDGSPKKETMAVNWDARDKSSGVEFNVDGVRFVMNQDDIELLSWLTKG